MSTRPSSAPAAAAQLDALVQAWLGTLSSESTRAAYRHDVTVFLAWSARTGGAPLAATSTHIDAFRVQCELDGAGASTVNRRLAAVASFFRHTGLADRTENPVAAVVRQPMRTKSSSVQLNQQQAVAVWRAATLLGDKTATIVGLVLLDGLKTNEILQLDVEHIVGRRADVVVNVLRRDRREPIMLDGRTAWHLRRYVAARKTGPVLLGDNPTRMPARLTRFGVDYIVKRTGIRAGLGSPLTVNTLRSTHIAVAHAAGMPLGELRRAVGHADSRTTRRYLTS